MRGQVSALYSRDQLYFTHEAQDLWEVHSHQMRACVLYLFVPIVGLATNYLSK